MKFLRLLLMLVLLSFCRGNGQSSYMEDREPLFYIGAYGDFNYNMHIADFDTLDGIPSCCPRYTGGSGTGFALGGFFEVPLVKDISLSVRLGFSTLNGKLTENDSIGDILVKDFNTGAEYKTGILVEHIIDSKIYTAGIEPTVDFFFFDRLTSQVGFRFGYIFTSRLDQNEKILSPDNVVFYSEEKRERNTLTDVELKKQAFQFSGVIGIGYELPLGANIFLVPEVRFDIPFTNITTATWKVAPIQFGAYLKVPVYPAQEIPVLDSIVYQRDTTVVAVMGLDRENVKLTDTRSESFKITRRNQIVMKEVITEHYIREVPKDAGLLPSVTAIGIDQDGRRQDVPTIIIEETEWAEGFPLLPQVFFKEGSSDLAGTGMKLLSPQDASNFQIDSLPWNTLSIYSDLLNIVGYRMKNNTKSVLTITGTNSDIGVEKGNQELSEDRAIAIKNYLVESWGIKESRIAVKKRNLPDNPSNNQDPDGQQENQRAELISNDASLLRPVNLKEIVRSSNPPTVKIYPSVISEAGVEYWAVNVEQSGNELRQFSGKDMPDSLTWNVQEEPLPKLEAPLNINLAVTDKLGQRKMDTKTIEIQQLTIQKKREVIRDDIRIERYSLIVFDFDKAEITPQQRPILEEIKKKIKPNSKVTISGYADRTGTPEYNKDLAQRRTLETQKILNVPEKNLTLNPVGSDELLYDNDIPEGRSYSRTVQIIIETPVK